MPEPSRGMGRRVPAFHAVQSRQVFYRYMVMAVGIVVCGVMVILVSLYLLVNTTPRVYHVFMMAFSFAVVILGVDIGRHNWPKGSRQSVVVDLRSVRLLEDVDVQKEFVFRESVRLGGSFNTAFHVPDFKPLAGVEFADPEFPVWSNTTAAPVGREAVASQLAAQLTSPVRFVETLQGMAADGIEGYLHVGPGAVTAGLAKRSVPGAAIHSVGHLSGIAPAAAALADSIQ